MPETNLYATTGTDTNWAPTVSQRRSIQSINAYQGGLFASANKIVRNVLDFQSFNFSIQKIISKNISDFNLKVGFFFTN